MSERRQAEQADKRGLLELDETNIRIARKFIREGNKDAALHSFSRAVQSIAYRHRRPDGFVEWSFVESAIGRILEQT